MSCRKCELGVHKYYETCWACGRTWSQYLRVLLDEWKIEALQQLKLRPQSEEPLLRDDSVNMIDSKTT